uniref:PTPc n=1 Tax=Tremella fuciformis TaxID=64657 RepID=D5KY16_9TREE|nr:PTPc [Tremella fuciformis]
MPRPPCATAARPSAPDLTQPQPAVFGHVVKTSDTHPIIISPFFPAELLPVLSAHLHPPTAAELSSGRPFLMTSAIDVPSLLLSFVPPSPNTLVPSLHGFRQHPSPTALGNLLLSSCPGKRLRMEGPVRGRGPVCRDLSTDLRRIKNEGVGCLVCCLDNVELAHLGVPWETYREVAAETGLDVIRLPMPDGFTPVSMALFDSQVGLIATEYTLKGANVLVHCRGGVGRAGLTACAWAIKMGFVQPHPSLSLVAQSSNGPIPAELEHQIVMSTVERVIAMIRSRRGLKAIESFEQVQFLASYVRWLRAAQGERL